MNLIIMIPTYNEEYSIASVVNEIPRIIPGIEKVQILVIDDGSTDRSIDVALQAGADRILAHKVNMGLAKTFRDGLETALEMGADIIVNIDADFQYNGNEIPQLVKPILDDKADIVLGDRQIDRLDHMPRGNFWGNKLVTLIIRWATGLPIRDAQTGFRAYSREAALRMNLTGDFTYTQESLIQAANKNLLIVQIPVEFRKRKGTSRLISSIFRYAGAAGVTIIRSFGTYHPFLVYSTIGVMCILIGFIFGLRVIVQFITTGMVTPYLPSALLTTVLVIVGCLSILFGLLADMTRTQRILLEEILYRLKK